MAADQSGSSFDPWQPLLETLDDFETIITATWERSCGCRSLVYWVRASWHRVDALLRGSQRRIGNGHQRHAWRFICELLSAV